MALMAELMMPQLGVVVVIAIVLVALAYLDQPEEGIPELDLDTAWSPDNRSPAAPLEARR